MYRDMKNIWKLQILDNKMRLSDIHNQPERSKREDLNNDLNEFIPRSFKPEDGYFPPPWNPTDFPEKTYGWLKFQKAMKEDTKYYLGCGALNTMET